MTDKTDKPASSDSRNGQTKRVVIDTESSPGAWAKELARRPKINVS